MEWVREIVEKYGKNESGLIPILQDIQKEKGYLPEDGLSIVATELKIPLSHVHALATFYKAFSLVPKGRYSIHVCLGTACHVKGAPKILDALERELDIKVGETTRDGLFDLEDVRCLGCCGLAPVITVGDDLYGGVTQAKLSRILKKCINKDEVKHAKTETDRS